MTSFQFFPVGGPLSAYVEYFYASYVPKHFVERITARRLPELSPQLVFAAEEEHAIYPGARAAAGGLRGSLFLQPAHLRVIEISPHIREAIGASLRPAGLRLLLPRGAEQLASGDLIALPELCKSGSAVLEDLLEAPGPHEKLAILRDYLTGLALRAPRSHPSAHRAIALMQEADGDICVEAIAERCGVTSRTLRNVLLSETGLSPKHIARIVRVRRALQLLRGEGAAPRSAGDNFADQAHMCREFRTLLGATPGHISRKMDARQEVPKYRTERDLVDTGLLIVGRRE